MKSKVDEVPTENPSHIARGINQRSVTSMCETLFIAACAHEIFDITLHEYTSSLHNGCIFTPKLMILYYILTAKRGANILKDYHMIKYLQHLFRFPNGKIFKMDTSNMVIIAMQSYNIT